MAQIPNLVPTTTVTDVDLLVTRQSGVDKNFTLLVMKEYLGVPAVGITPYMGTLLDDSTDVTARATLGVTRADNTEASEGTSTTLTMSPATTKEAIFTHAVPAGSPVPWPTSSVPAGWAECNGDSFVLVDNPQLALAYPTGFLPDLRGEFIRGWDNGRGVDTGRTVYSSQESATQKVEGSFVVGGVSGVNPMQAGEATGFISTGDNRTVSSGGTSAVNGDSKYIFDNSTTVRTSDEDRPRNVSFMYIVRLA